MNELTKVWVYQSSREFSQEEVQQLEQVLNHFVSGWNAHGEQLDSQYKIMDNQFIVLFVDESNHGASGCSIDSSVQNIKKIEQDFNCNLTDKGLVGYKDGKGKTQIISFKDVRLAIMTGKINEDTVIYNNSISTFKEFENNWQIKAKDSWLSRFFVTNKG